MTEAATEEACFLHPPNPPAKKKLAESRGRAWGRSGPSPTKWPTLSPLELKGKERVIRMQKEASQTGLDEKPQGHRDAFKYVYFYFIYQPAIYIFKPR